MSEPMPEDELLDLGQFQINKLLPGLYEMSEIYGEYYEAAILTPQHFGKVFRKSCGNGRLTRIKFSHMDEGNKHLYYEVG